MPETESVFSVAPGLNSAAAASPGFDWVNKPSGGLDGSPRGFGPGPLPSPCYWGFGSGFPLEMEPPQLRTGKQYGRLPLKDFEPAHGGLWLVSESAKNLLESTDADAFVFCSAEVERSGAERDADRRWLCDVVRFLDAINEQKSDLRITDYGGGQRLVQIEYPTKALFRRDTIGAAQIFRSVYNSLHCHCTASFRDRVRSSGLTGLGFLAVGTLDR